VVEVVLQDGEEIGHELGAAIHLPGKDAARGLSVQSLLAGGVQDSEEGAGCQARPSQQCGGASQAGSAGRTRLMPQLAEGGDGLLHLRVASWDCCKSERRSLP